MSVADTILRQLRSNRLVAMTGANTFTSTENSLSFRIGANPKRINGVRIVLRNDEYDIEFVKVSVPKMDRRTGEIVGGHKVVSKADGIQVSQLHAVIERHTGLLLSL
jgi:hypothetical protein